MQMMPTLSVQHSIEDPLVNEQQLSRDNAVESAPHLAQGQRDFKLPGKPRWQIAPCSFAMRKLYKQLPKIM